MVYYSPYKNIFRAFMRAIRVFISSLFSKRLLIMVIVALVIMLLHLNVHAESIYQDGYVYRQITNNGYDEDTDTYSFDYRVYMSDGIHEGVVILPSNLYNLNNYFIHLNNNGVPELFVSTTGASTLYLYGYASSSTNTFPSFKKSSIYEATYSIYRYTDNNWNLITSGYKKLTSIKAYDYQPNGILYTKNLNIVYGNCNDEYNNNKHFNYSDLINNQILKTPDLYLRPNIGFRLYLNDMIPYNFSDDEDWDKNYSLSNSLQLVLHILDINTQTVVTETTLTGIDIDDDNNYFVDIFFDDTLSYMNKFDGDYVILVGSNLTSIKKMNAEPNLNYGNTVVFQSVDYWRYVYYSDLGAGILRQVNDDGSLKEGEEAIPTSDELAEQLAQQEAERKEQEKEQTRLDAINGVTNSIDNFSNDFFSTNADDITMEDFGVQSPIIENEPDLSNVFNMLYNSFMQVYEDDIYRIQFGLPFIDKTFNYDIPADALRSKLPNEFVILIGVFWWVVLGGFVITFIVKIIHQIVTYSNGSVDGKSSGGFLSELTMTPTEFVLFNILH